MKLEFIKKVKTHNDGSETWLFEYDKSFEQLVKNHYNMKRISKKAIQKFVIEGLRNYLKFKGDKNE